MSRQNVEVVRRAYEAWNAGDLDAAAEFLDPVIEWRMPPNFPEAGTYQGIEEVKSRLEEFLESWEEFQVEVEELIETGDRVVALTRSRAEAKASGWRSPALPWTLRFGR
jgi:ketosteroid isomerase-like protein